MHTDLHTGNVLKLFHISGKITFANFVASFLSPASFLKKKSSRDIDFLTTYCLGQRTVEHSNLFFCSIVLPNPLLSVICDSIIHEGLSQGLTVCKLLANLHIGIGLNVCVRICACV